MLKKEIENLFRKNSNFEMIDDMGVDKVDKVKRKFYRCFEKRMVAYIIKKSGLITRYEMAFSPNGFYSSSNQFIPFIGLKEIKKQGNKYYFSYENGQQIVTLDELVAEYVLKMFEIYKKYVESYKKCVETNNFEKAIEYYKETISYDNKIADEFFQIGIDYYNKQEYIKAIAYFKASCDSELFTYTKAYDEKNKYAYYNIGLCYEFGLGVKKDYHKAKDYYYKSNLCDQNYSDAFYRYCLMLRDCSETDLLYYKIQYNKQPRFIELIGECYYNGWTVRKDNKTAKSYFKQVENECVEAIYYLGQIAKDEKEYDDFYNYTSMALNKGMMYAYNALGEAYQNGYGVDKNIIKAKECYENMIQNFPDNSLAYSNLGTIYKSEKNDLKAFELFDQSFNLGNRNIVIKLAKMCIEEENEVHDVYKGIHYLDVAISEGNLEAILYKAHLFIQGHYVSKDIQLAYETLINGFKYDEEGILIGNELTNYICKDTFGHDFNTVSKIFKEFLDIFKLKQALEENFELIKSYYKKVFIEHFGLKKSNEECRSNGFTEGLYFYNDGDYSYYLEKETGSEIRSFPYIYLPQNIVEGDKVDLTLIAGDALFIDFSENQGFVYDEELEYEECIELSKSDPYRSVASLKKYVYDGNYIGYFGLGEVYLNTDQYSAAYKMYQKVIDTGKMPMLAKAKCRELQLLLINKSNLPNSLSINNFKKANEIVELLTHKNSNNSLYNAYLKAKEKPSYENLKEYRFEVNPANIKYKYNYKDLYPVTLAIECVEIMLIERETEVTDTTKYLMTLKNFYRGKNNKKSIEYGRRAFDAEIPAALYDAAHNPYEYGVALSSEEAYECIKQAASYGYQPAKDELFLQAEALKQNLREYKATLENNHLDMFTKQKELDRIERNIMYNAKGESMNFNQAEEKGLISYSTYVTITDLKKAFLD